jgi:hypothetical protein
MGHCGPVRFPSIEDLRLGPDDKLVLATKRTLTADQLHRISQDVGEWLKGERKVLMLDAEISILVVRGSQK